MATKIGIGEKRKTFTRFAGIRDKEDPLRVKNHQIQYVGLRTAKNLDIDDDMKINPVPGFTAVDLTATDDIYASEVSNNCYVIRDGNLYYYNQDSTTELLYSDIGARGEWTEVNGTVYFTNGSSFLVIQGHNVRDWGIPVPGDVQVTVGAGNFKAGDYQLTCTFRAPDGRESGAQAATIVDAPDESNMGITLPTLAGYETVLYMSQPNGDVLYEVLVTTDSHVVLSGVGYEGVALSTQHLSPPPGGDIVTEHQGRICLGQYLPELEASVVWRSEPLGYELFDQYGDAVLLIPGEITILGSAGQHLIIGTKDKVYGYNETDINNPKGLTEFVETGAIAGTLAKDVHNQVWFWTNRGVAKAMPFELVTDDYFAAPSAERGTGVIIQQSGFGKYSTILTNPTNKVNPYE